MRRISQALLSAISAIARGDVTATHMPDGSIRSRAAFSTNIIRQLMLTEVIGSEEIGQDTVRYFLTPFGRTMHLISAAAEMEHSLTMVRDADEDNKITGEPAIPAPARSQIDFALNMAGSVRLDTTGDTDMSGRRFEYRPMTAAQFSEELRDLCLKPNAFARIFGVGDRTVARWIAGTADIPAWVPITLQLLKNAGGAQKWARLAAGEYLVRDNEHPERGEYPYRGDTHVSVE